MFNILTSRRGFEGGLFVQDHKSVLARRPIETVPIRGPLFIPLTAGRDLPTRSIVEVGQRVEGGQALSAALAPGAVQAFAPTSGTIVGFEMVQTVAEGELPGVRLEPDDRDTWLSPRLLDEYESLVNQLAGRGVMCSSPRGPAHGVLQRAAEAQVSELIVNGVETEPYLSAELRTLVELPGRIIDMTCELADALGVARAIVALPYRHRRVIRRLAEEARGRLVEVVGLSEKYPQCHPVVLVKTLLDREVKPGQTVLDEGALVIPVTMVRACADAVLDDRPATHAVMTVAGDAVAHPGVYRVAVGTPLAALAEHAGLLGPIARAVWGGPLTGSTLATGDAVVTLDALGLLLFTSAPRVEPVPCIHCGWCVEDCPVGLEPVSLLNLDAREAWGPRTTDQLAACIECGLCSYVCPSQLPLTQRIIESRRRALPLVSPSSPAAVAVHAP